jgi:pseudaminic acid cytidylyltransferase
MKLCVIPARGGSKRIPRKNIKDFCGQPMIAWAIEAAHASQCFDRILVSTDDPEISEIAEQFAAAAPFVRPAELADDHTGLIAVVRHTIAEMQCDPMDEVCCLYPTAAFVEANDLAAGLKCLEVEEIDFCLAVTPFRTSVERALQLGADGCLTMFNPDRYLSRSQDLKPAYHDAGQFCWGRAEAWLRCDNVFLARCASVILPNHRAHDIDTLDDWTYAELMLRAMRGCANGTGY